MTMKKVNMIKVSKLSEHEIKEAIKSLEVSMTTPQVNPFEDRQGLACLLKYMVELLNNTLVEMKEIKNDN